MSTTERAKACTRCCAPTSSARPSGFFECQRSVRIRLIDIREEIAGIRSLTKNATESFGADWAMKRAVRRREGQGGGDQDRDHAPAYQRDEEKKITTQRKIGGKFAPRSAHFMNCEAKLAQRHVKSGSAESVEEILVSSFMWC